MYQYLDENDVRPKYINLFINRHGEQILEDLSSRKRQ